MDNTKRWGAALGRANQLKQEGNLERALANYRQAVELNPHSFWCHYNMGEILARQGKDEEAMISYTHALEIEPNHAWIHHNLGKILARMGKTTEAIVSQQRAIELQPDLCWAYYSLGSIFFQQGNLDEALAAFYQAIQLQPGVAAFHKSLAEVLSSLERNSEAAKAYFEAGEKFIEQNSLSEAVNAYRQVILLNGESSECYKKLGSALAVQGNFGAAIDAYQEGINLNVEDDELYSGLGVALAILGRLEETVSAYNRAVEILHSKPTDTGCNKLATIYHNQGEALEGLDNKPAAIKAYELALEVDPNRGVTRLKLGILLAKDRQFESGLDCYKKAIAFSLEEIKDCQELKVLLKIFVRKDYVQQVILSHREMEPSQSIVGLYYKLALILAELDKLDEAVICFQEASQLLSQITPKHSPSWQFSRHPSTEEEIYENLWQALNQPNLERLDEISDSYPREIDFDKAVAYFNKTGEYRVVKMFDLKEGDRELLAEKGLSFDILQLIGDNRNIHWQQIIHYLDAQQKAEFSEELKIPFWQQSILETGYINLVCPISGYVIKSNHSLCVNLGYTGGQSIFISYRFLGKQIFYLFSSIWSFRKSCYLLYFPNSNLIVTYYQSIPDCLISKTFSEFKGLLVTYNNLVVSYFKNSNKRKIAALDGCVGNIGHYFLDYLPEFHNLFVFDKLQKIKVFLVAPYTWVKINELYPEISPLSVILSKDRDITLFKAVIQHNCMALILSFNAKITTSFEQKIYNSSLSKISSNLFIKTVYKTKANYPLILFQIRVGRRVWRSQVEGIAEIITKLYFDFPNLAIILDGWTQKEGGNLPQENSIVEQEMTLAHEILDRIPTEVTTHLIIGQGAREKVVWTEAIDLFVAPFGANCAIPLWVVNKPGILHSNQYITKETLKRGQDYFYYRIIYYNLRSMVPPENIVDTIPGGRILTDYDFDGSIIYEEIKIMLPQIADSQSFDPINDFWD